MAACTPTLMKPYTRFVNYNASRQAAYALTPRANRAAFGVPRSPLNCTLATQKTPPVLCSIDPTGSTDGAVLGMYRNFHVALKKWCDQQCFLVGAAVFTAFEGLEAALFFGVWSMLTEFLVGGPLPASFFETVKPHLGIFYPLLPSIIGGPLLIARSFAVLFACKSGVPYVTKRLTGKKENDILTGMMEAFITVVMFFLVSGVRGPVIIVCGVINALVSAFIHAVNHQFRGK